MLRHRILRFAAIVLAASTAIASPALADQSRHTDATHDMVISDGVHYSDDAGHANADLTTVRVRHRTHRVFVRAGFRALHPSTAPGGRLALSGFVRVNPAARDSSSYYGYYYRVWYDADRPHVPHIEVTDDTEFSPTCEADGNHHTSGYRANHYPNALNSRIDYGRRILRLSINRSCLGRPRWIRVNATSSVGSPEREWLDEWRNPFVEELGQVGANFSPRLSRG